jgi:hypothetical protein
MGQRLQDALNAQSEKLESNASSLFARLRWAKRGKVILRGGFGGELDGLRTELEKLAHDSCKLYAKLPDAEAKGPTRPAAELHHSSHYRSVSTGASHRGC